MRRTGNPSVVTRDGKHHLLSRVEFSDRRLAEDFLQESLHRSPQILPVEEIDPAFSPLVSLGREIDSIDNLFISPAGKITLVETKLWRNPEATREVVAQVLDYATRLSSWSYSGLENAVRNAQPPAPIGSASLYDFIAKKYPREVLPEEQFLDEVQKNLRATRFVLLVVGDGIRENLEKMLGHLHKHPQMLFTFCLVEIQIYENSALFDGRLLMPMLVAQTTEIVRAVVRVETTGQAQVSVAIAEENESKGSAGRRTLSEDIFFSEIQDERTQSLDTTECLVGACYETLAGLRTQWTLSSAGHVELSGSSGGTNGASGRSLGLFRSSEGRYRLDVDVLSDTSVLNKGNPRLRVEADWEGYARLSRLYDELPIVPGMLVVIGGIWLLLSRTKRSTALGISAPSGIGCQRAGPLRRFPRRALFSGLPSYGLYATFGLSLLLVISLYFEGLKPPPTGIWVFTSNRSLKTPTYGPWDKPSVLRIDREDRWFLDGKPVSPEDFPGALKKGFLSEKCDGG